MDRQLTSDQFAQLQTRYSFWRHPADRMASAFRMYSTPLIRSCHSVESFEKFVLEVCENHKNDVHVIPQSLTMKDINSIEIKWDFDKLREALGLPEIIPENVSDNSIACDWTEIARAAFNVAYGDCLKRFM